MMVGIDEMRKAIRLALELRDFVPGTEAQARHLIAGMGAMVGAYVTMSLELEGVPFRPTIVRALDLGWDSGDSRQHFLDYLANRAHREDPLAHQINAVAFPGKIVTCTRRDILEDKAWYRSAHLDEYRRPSGLDDCIYSILVRPRVTYCFSVHRPWKDRPFTERDRAIIQAIHAECAPLLEDVESMAMGALNRRLRETLDGLLRGLSEKELASELELSPHTLHQYVKSLYRRLGVSSRGELHARFDRLRSRRDPKAESDSPEEGNGRALELVDKIGTQHGPYDVPPAPRSANLQRWR